MIQIHHKVDTKRRNKMKNNEILEKLEGIEKRLYEVEKCRILLETPSGYIDVLENIASRLDKLDGQTTPMNAYDRAIAKLPTMEEIFGKSKVNFNDMSWEEISTTNKDLFNVGDYKDETLKSGEPIRIYIANIEPFRLLFAIDGEYRMNDTGTNKGGWEASRMRLVTMPQIKNLLPDELVEVLEAHDDDELSLMSRDEYESFGIFKEKELRDLFNGHYWYWLKTPFPSITNFCGVNADGSRGNSSANSSHGVFACLTIKNNQPT